MSRLPNGPASTMPQQPRPVAAYQGRIGAMGPAGMYPFWMGC